MAKSTRRLGRGLDSLVSTLRMRSSPDLDDASPAIKDGQIDIEGSSPASTKTIDVSVHSIRPNAFQPRGSITEENLDTLVQSIRKNGILQPILVRPVEDGYEIIAGERRWRAAKIAGNETITASVKNADDEQMLELALIENIHREDLNPMERALAYRRFSTQFGLSAEEVGQRTGEDRTTVTNYLRLLDLSAPLQELVASGRLSMGHARCLLGVRSDARRMELATAAAYSELSVRALEKMVRQERRRDEGLATDPPQEVRVRSAHLQDLERRFEEAMRTKVTIHEGKRKGTGRVVIEYQSLDDFDRIADRLGVVTE